MDEWSDTAESLFHGVQWHRADSFSFHSIEISSLVIHRANSIDLSICIFQAAS